MWIYLPINPDPWAIGPVSVGKRNGKMIPIVGRNAQLDAFKNAVREELESQGVKKVNYSNYDIKFFFWRKLESNTGGSRKNIADATNMQKATEDALQDVLIGNDRDVKSIQSIIVDQGPDVKKPGILIYLTYYDLSVVDMIPEEMWDKATGIEPEPLFDNSWGGPLV